MPAVIPLAIAAATTTATIVSQQDAARKAQHAVSDAQKVAGAVDYQPIDIAQLTANAHDQAVKNATDSLALERSLQPDIADTRTNLSRSISDQLKLGGQLPTDTINAVTQAGRVAGGTSGSLGGASVPLTAGLLGLSSLNLLNQRQNNAAGLLAPVLLRRLRLNRTQRRTSSIWRRLACRRILLVHRCRLVQPRLEQTWPALARFLIY